MILADVDYLDQNSVTKLIKDFKNPVVEDEAFLPVTTNEERGKASYIDRKE